MKKDKLHLPQDYVEIKDIPYIYFDMDIFEGDIDLVVEKILDIKNQLREAIKQHNANSGINKITPISKYALIKLERDYYSDSIEFRLKCYRLKTEEEKKLEEYKKKKQLEVTKKAAKEREKKKKEKELKLLKKLKEKYPNT